MHQSHCLLRQKPSSEKEIQYVLEIITCDPQYIEDIYFFEVNTKYISSSVLKASEFS